jgi:hypothetical protein
MKQGAAIILRIMLGVCLALFLIAGLHDALGYSGGTPEVGIAVAALVICIPIAAMFRVPLTPYGVGSLIVAAGLLIIGINHFLNLIYGYDWFEGLWYFAPDWIRYVTYSSLGYVVARQKGAWIGVLVSFSIACFDVVFGWAALLPTQSRMFGVDHVRSNWPYLVSLLGLSGAIWSFCGVLGAILSRVRWMNVFTQEMSS